MIDEVKDQTEEAPILAPLVTGSVERHLFRQAVPMAYGIIAIFGYSLVDTYFIAQLGTYELAAITFTGPVIGLIHGLTFGLGIGVASVVSRGIGSGDHRQIRRVATDSLLLGAVIVAILIALGFATLTPLFTAMRADQDTLPLIREYMEIYYLGAMFLIVPMIGISAIRAAGDTKSVGRILIISGVVNIILDPLLIFGWGPFPRLEMRGAALATVLAEIATFGITFYLLRRKQLIAKSMPN
jgi:putative MATE family efflux protein